MKLLFVYTPFSNPVSPPAGIAYLKGFINDNFPKIKVNCLDLNLDWYKTQSKKKSCYPFFKFSKKEEEIKRNLSLYLEDKAIKEKSIFKTLNKDVKKIDRFKPDIVGFSILLKSQLVYSLALSKLIKKRNKKIKIIFGGASLILDNLSDIDKLVSNNNIVDFIVGGGGEYHLLSLLKNIRKTKLKIRKNEGKSRLEMPFALSCFPNYSDFKLKEYFISKTILPIHIAKGCSWSKCTFCQAASSGPKFIAKKINKIIKEIKFLKKEYNTKSFYFIAPEVPVFLLKKISEALIKSKLKIYYSIYARPVSSINDDLLKKLYKSGCRLINYGVESFTQRILNLMGKGTRTGEILDLLKRTKKAGIKTYCWYIVGFPSQKEKELENEMAIIKKNSQYIDLLGCHTFFLKKHSLMYSNNKLLTPGKNKSELFLEINGIEIFKDEQISFKAKSGISRIRAKKWADIIGREFESCKNANFSKASNDLREFYILSSVSK